MGILSKLFGSDKKDRIKEMLNNGAIIVDVRTPNEFASGHVSGSKNIPLAEISTEIAQLKKQNKPIVVCCASGMRSAQAKTILKGEGIEVENAGSWHALKQ